MSGCELQKLSYQRDFRVELSVSDLCNVVQDVGYPIFIGISLKAETSETDGFRLFLRFELRLSKLQDLN